MVVQYVYMFTYFTVMKANHVMWCPHNDEMSLSAGAPYASPSALRSKSLSYHLFAGEGWSSPSTSGDFWIWLLKVFSEPPHLYPWLLPYLCVQKDSRRFQRGCCFLGHVHKCESMPYEIDNLNTHMHGFALWISFWPHKDSHSKLRHWTKKRGKVHTIRCSSHRVKLSWCDHLVIFERNCRDCQSRFGKSSCLKGFDSHLYI